MPDSTTFAAWYLAAATGRRLCVSWRPADREPRASLLLIPPFGEEMNKSRRTLALSARRFAQAGYAVLFMDLYGTGDSDGEFGEATWAMWIDDLGFALTQLRNESHAPIHLWAVRAGALLATEIAKEDSVAMLHLWQPVVNGDTFLTQLLRMKIANESFATGTSTVTTRDLKAQLFAGKPLEVGGYELNPALVLPMSEKSLTNVAPPSTDIVWLETGTAAQTEYSVPSQKTMASWREQGAHVRAQYVQGDPFWMTQEITENTSLVEQSLQFMDTVSA